MSTILIFSYLILFLFLSIKKLSWALMLILAGLPLYLIRFSILGIPSTLLEAMILIAFAVWLIKNYKLVFENCKLKINNCLKIVNCKLEINRYPFDTEIILLLIISFIAAGIAGFDNAALGIWKAYFFEPALVYILIFNVFFKNKKEGGSSEFFSQISKLILPLAISALIVSLIAVAQKFGFIFSPENFWPRITGPYGYPNALGLFLGPIIMLMAGAFFSAFIYHKQENSSQSQILKLLFLFAAIFSSIISIYFARSEGAIVGVFAAVAACLYLLFLFQKFIPLLVRKIGLGLLAIFLLAVLVYPVLALKVFPEHKYPDFGSPALNSLYDKAALKDFSGEVRKQQWRETWEMMKDERRWLFGAGLSGYQAAVAPYHDEGIYFNKDRDPDFRRKIVLFDDKYRAEHWRPVEIYMYPHNLLLNFWTELGLAGAILFVWIMFRILYIGICNLFGNWKPEKSRRDLGPYTGLEIGNWEQERKKYLWLGIIGAITTILVHGIVDVPYFKNDLAVLFWVLMAMAGYFRLLFLEKK